MVVLAVDPGVTTGVASIMVPEPFDWSKLHLGPESLQTHNLQMLPSNDLAEWFAREARFIRPVKIVVESFRLFRKHAADQIGSDFPSVRVIGHLEMLAYKEGLFDCLTYQDPSIQVNWPPNVLKKYGMNLSGRSTHELSATKHLMQWLRLYSRIKQPQ